MTKVIDLKKFAIKASVGIPQIHTCDCCQFQSMWLAHDAHQILPDQIVSAAKKHRLDNQHDKQRFHLMGTPFQPERWDCLRA